jgi:hypothetical protein
MWTAHILWIQAAQHIYRGLSWKRGEGNWQECQKRQFQSLLKWKPVIHNLCHLKCHQYLTDNSVKYLKECFSVLLITTLQWQSYLFAGNIVEFYWRYWDKPWNHLVRVVSVPVRAQTENFRNTSIKHYLQIHLTRATQRNIPEDTILHSHRRENLKSYKFTLFV